MKRDLAIWSVLIGLLIAGIMFQERVNKALSVTDTANKALALADKLRADIALLQPAQQPQNSNLFTDAAWRAGFIEGVNFTVERVRDVQSGKIAPTQLVGEALNRMIQGPHPIAVPPPPLPTAPTIQTNPPLPLLQTNSAETNAPK